MAEDDTLEWPEGLILGPYCPVSYHAQLIVCPKFEPMPEAHLGTAWSALTSPLELAGSAAMRPSAEGGFDGLNRLLASAPWARSIITEIERQMLAQLALARPWVKFDPILLVGPPGSGKTWFARRLAEAVQLPSAALELANTTDDRLLSGTPRGWSNMHPAWPLQVIADTRKANPLLVLDELDKAGGSARNGLPHHALLSLIEPSSAVGWYDQCLLANCNLSQVNWIGCANALDGIPAPLLSRFQVAQVPPPSGADFDPMLASITSALASDWGVSASMLPVMPHAARRLLRKRFTQHLSFRHLARDVRRILTAQLADGKGPRRH